MATDFFERQDAARRNTTLLVALFVAAVLALVVATDLVFGITLAAMTASESGGVLDWSRLFDPGVMAMSLLGTLAIVGGGSAYKIARLSSGGHVIAEELGGRRLAPDSTDPLARKILNVVEEMAIASGTPVPQVFLLDHEQGINAFAAGHDPSDAVIGITRGAAERLTRDELQGVVAHEFSHILHGDMTINLRLIGVLHGILLIGMLGQFVLRSSWYASLGSRRNRRDDGRIAIMALGAALAVIGFLGTFFGNLIKAAVSRQREYLADASAVQFTRQPLGLAGALKKIGGWSEGSAVHNPNAPEASHLFFGRATSGLSAMFSTHPPLDDRIRRLDPSWDGALPAVPLAPLDDVAPGAAGLAGGQAPPPHEAGGVAHAVTHVGQPSEAHVAHAAALHRALPWPLVSAAHEPYGARALVFALLLDDDAEVRTLQLQQLADTVDAPLVAETRRLAAETARVDVRQRLPLLDIALPALRALTDDQRAVFHRALDQLIRADGVLHVFEWALQRILAHDLAPRRDPGRRATGQPRSVAAVADPAEVLLSILAHVGAHRDADAPEALRLAADVLGVPLTLRPADTLDIHAFDAALDVVEAATPDVKRRVLHAAAACVTADEEVTASEAELLRAVAASFGVPMPPVLSV